MVEIFKKHSLIIANILIAVSCVLIFIVFQNNLYNFEIEGLTKVVEHVSVNLAFDNESNKKTENYDIKACFDTYCTPASPRENFNTYYAEFDEKYIVDNFRIRIPKSINLDTLDYIYIYSGSRNYHYNKKEIKEFDKSFDEEYTILNIPEIDNYAGIFNHICVLFLSLFYNAKYFIFPYILLFLGFTILFFNQNIKIKPRLIIPIILIAVILRLDHITYVPLWVDELYTKYVALDSFKSTFTDPGNPPLFFILEYIFTKIFSNSDLSIRFLPMMFGILTIPAIWLLFKDISKNFALFASFMASINSIMIYRSQEARAYSLDVLLVIVAAYLLFKFLENPNTKNIILNAIMTALLINTNYYLIITAGGNILWGLIFSKGKKEDKIKYFIANCIAGLTLLPYLIISFGSALDSSFNSYIPKPSAKMFDDMVFYYLLNNTVATIVVFIVLINFILYFIPEIKQNLKNKYYPYLFYIFNFTVIGAILISANIKPMMYRGNILAIYGLFFLLVICAVFPVIEFKNKFAKFGAILYTVPLSFMFFNMTYPYHERCVDNIYDYMHYVAADSAKYNDKGYEIHTILPHVVPKVSDYREFDDVGYINWHIVRMGSSHIFIQKDDYTSKDKKVVIYIPLVGVEYFVNNNPPNLYYDSTNYVNNGKLVY